MKKRIFDIIQIGNREDLPSRAFDWFIVLAILVNIVTMFLSTFNAFQPYLPVLHLIELLTAVIFCAEYSCASGRPICCTRTAAPHTQGSASCVPSTASSI